MRAAVLFFILAMVAACGPAPETAGRALYTAHCTGCHGTGGEGDGPLSRGLDRAVPDLTGIAARNGGSFPMVRVMSVIDGYTRREAGNITMPEFGAELQEGRLVRVDTGDGISSPTPERLVQLAEYLRSIQR